MAAVFYPYQRAAASHHAQPQVDHKSTTKLIRAIEKDDIGTFQALLRYGADANGCVDEFGTTAIHVAAGLDCRNIVWMLEKMLQSGGNPNARNAEQMTPVHVASIENRVECLRVLLEYGGDPLVKCEDGFTAMGYARKYRSADCVAFLTELYLQEKKGLDQNTSAASLQSEYFSCQATPEAPTYLPEGRTVTRSRNHSLVSQKSEDSYREVSPPMPRRPALKRRSCSSGSTGSSRQASASRRAAVFSSDSDDDSGLPLSRYGSKVSLNAQPTRATSEEPVGNYRSPLASSRSRPRLSSELDAEPSAQTQERHRDFDDEFASYTSVTDADIRQQLRALGAEPGPINTSESRAIYIRRLIVLKRIRALEGSSSDKSTSVFCAELEKIITGDYDHDEMEGIEQDFHRAFEKSGQTGKRGYFTYLLLDPRVSQNLPHQFREGSDANVLACAKTFLRSAFYIGKGKNSRPMHHLTEAKQSYRYTKGEKISHKIRRITEIWNADYGVVSLQCFNGMTEDEAFTREHLMMEALGMERLTNDRRSKSYGAVAKWSGYRRRMMGSYFLMQAFGILLKEGERQIFPQNV